MNCIEMKNFLLPNNYPLFSSRSSELSSADASEASFVSLSFLPRAFSLSHLIACLFDDICVS